MGEEIGDKKKKEEKQKMSVVTTVLICGALGVEDKAEEINEYLKGEGHYELQPIIGHGGEKVLYVDILQGAFNHLDVGSFIDFLVSLDWKRPTDLFFMEENESRFTREKLDTFEEEDWKK